MGRNLLRVCVHFVWATRDRLPLVTDDIELRLHLQWPKRFGQ
jgi:hypothetical protein